MSGTMNAREVKRSLSIAGHRTSVSLEEPFWLQLKAIAAHDGLSVAALVGLIDAQREPGDGSLSGSIRVFILNRLLGRLSQNH
jgi:predicted DNA-binding ribbon-helix-helix protein